MKVKKIALLTGGGDCPGLNGVIRAVVKKSILDYNISAYGIEDGFEGLLENRIKALTYDDVSSILTIGGTILGTSNKTDPFRVPQESENGIIFKDYSYKCIKNLQEREIDCLVCIGGDGTLTIANQISKLGVNVIGVPKTIDNDLAETDVTFGFDSAVSIATEAIDRIHTTAQSHHRVMLVEVMGRNAGWIALYSGIAGGGDIILIPEIPYDIEVICNHIKWRLGKGRRSSIIVVAEGAKPLGGDVVVKRIIKDSAEPVRLGGVGQVLADEIEKRLKIETRVTILGHLQRGGSPTAHDRILATYFGSRAVDLIVEGKFGNMVALQGNVVTYVPLEKAVSYKKNVPLNHPLILAAKSVGTSFGDR